MSADQQVKRFVSVAGSFKIGVKEEAAGPLTMKMVKNCSNCGLGIPQSDGQISCFKYRTLNKADEDKTSCLFHIETVLEDGVPLLPMQHLLLKEVEIKQRGMIGPLGPN